MTGELKINISHNDLEIESSVSYYVEIDKSEPNEPPFVDLELEWSILKTKCYNESGELTEIELSQEIENKIYNELLKRLELD